jgi:hypothetical protein
VKGRFVKALERSNSTTTTTTTTTNSFHHGQHASQLRSSAVVSNSQSVRNAHRNYKSNSHDRNSYPNSSYLHYQQHQQVQNTNAMFDDRMRYLTNILTRDIDDEEYAEEDEQYGDEDQEGEEEEIEGEEDSDSQQNRNRNRTCQHAEEGFEEVKVYKKPRRHSIAY